MFLIGRETHLIQEERTTKGYSKATEGLPLLNEGIEVHGVSWAST